jgi:Tol biopolymer transport system component
MITQPKVRVAIFLIVCVSAISYLLGRPLLTHNRPAIAGADRIAFTAGSSFGLSGFFLNYDIYVMNVNSPGLTRLTWQADVDEMPTWSPTGDKIAYARIDGVYVVNADGSGQPELIWGSRGRGTITDPAWSPDGSKIAFSEGVIYVLDVKTRKVAQLTDVSIPSDHPTWSPDGKEIAFTFRPSITTPGGGPKGAICKINVDDGSSFVRLTDVDGSDSPSWSPDGDRIAFQRGGNIYVMEANGTNTRVLIQDGKSYSPTWSPRGDKIAFISAANQSCGPSLWDSPGFCTTELRVMDEDGSDVVVIRAIGDEQVIDPAWSP